MPEAKTILDCMRIRAANREFLDSINSTQGTAIGLKEITYSGETTKQPAIIVFVPHKIHPKWLPESQLIPKELIGPDGLTCCLDVVEGSKGERNIINDRDESDLGIRLRGWDSQIWAGSQITSWTDVEAGKFTLGTIGSFARDKETRELGILTNQHIARSVGSKIFHPLPWGRQIAITIRSELFSVDEKWYGSLIDEPSTYVRTDCAFAAIADDFPKDDLNPHLMGIGSLGPVLDIDLTDESMSPIDLEVVRVGRTTGIRRGRIVAFGYEYKDLDYETRYTDLLIAGTDKDQAGFDLPFSAVGDSGSLIVTADQEKRPLGLLWGGGFERRRKGFGQEKWSWGICLSRVLDTLNIELISENI